MPRKKKTDSTALTTVTPELQSELEQAREQAALAVQSLVGASIDTQQEHDLVTDWVRVARERRNVYEEKRKTITRPMDEAKAAVMDLFRPTIEYLDAYIKGCNGLLDAHAQAQRSAALAAQQAIRQSGVSEVPSTVVAVATGEHAVMLAKGSYTRTVYSFEFDYRAIDTGVVCHLVERGIDPDLVRAVQVALGVPDQSAPVRLTIDHDQTERAVNTFKLDYKAHGIEVKEHVHVVA